MKSAPPGRVDLVVYDFDGVMTDNRALVSQDGVEAVWVSRADGWGVGMLKREGVPQLILSTEANPVVSARAAKLAIPCEQNCADKREALEAYCRERGHRAEHVVYVGNDLNDLQAMQWVGWPVAPGDAHPRILQIARHVTAANGGFGVVRELADWLLAEEGGA